MKFGRDQEQQGRLTKELSNQVSALIAELQAVVTRTEEAAALAAMRLEVIRQRDELLEQREGLLQIHSNVAEERLNTIHALESTAEERLSLIRALESTAEERLQVMQAQEQVIQEQGRALAAYRASPISIIRRLVLNLTRRLQERRSEP